MSGDPRLSDLLLRWEELRDQGRPATVEDLCRDCPELVETLRRKVQALEAMDSVLCPAPTAPLEPSTQECAPADPAAAARVSRAHGLLPHVPGYEVLRELGRGGMGVVYAARHARLDRHVALKMILLGPHASEEQRRRFRAEAEAVARIQNPNIVQIYEVGEADGLAFCALELIDGGNLAQRLGGVPQPPREAAELVAMLAGAVQAAHASGIVHRDLKPTNVLLTRTGVAKVADFGLAKRLDTDATLTATGAVLGTPSYMAPEQSAGSKTVGPAADVWALGAIFYECLTGRPPFRAANRLDTLEQVREQEPVPPAQLQPRVPRDLETICLKCLRKDPSKRYARAQDLADDLRRFLRGEPIRARPVPSWERALKWARRRPTAATLLAVISLGAATLLLVGLAYNAELRAERDEAERQKIRAAASEAQARHEKEEADANFCLARQVVGEFARTLSEDEHAPVEQLRQELLQSTQDFYEQFVRQRSDDTGLRAAQGKAFLQLARINAELGAREKRALGQYRDARAIFEALLRQSPENPAYRQELALVGYHEGRAYRDLDRLADAEESLTTALKIQRRLLESDPNSAEYRRHLADISLALGQVKADRGQTDQAEAAYRNALAVIEALAQQRSPTPADEDALGDVQSRLAALYLDLRQHDQARGAASAALAIEEKLVRQHPATVNYRNDLAGSYVIQARILFAEGKKQEAAEALQKALPIRRRLAEEHGRVTQLVVGLGQTYVVLAEQSDTPTGAIEWFTQAIRTLDGVQQKEPHDRDCCSLLGAAYQGRAQALDRLGRNADALADWGRAKAVAGGQSIVIRLGVALTLVRLGRYAEAAKYAELLKAQNLSTAQRMDLSRVYALCARAATVDVQVSAPEREHLEEQFAARAVALLSGAGSRAAQSIEHDPDFEAVRPRKDFQDLLRIK
jgi:serine/threonine-protein kinase